MIQKITVEGANLKATVSINTDICGNPYTEAATKALEMVFGNGPDTADEAEIILENPLEAPNVGFIMKEYNVGDENDEDKHFYVLTRKIAENAGLPWMVEQLKAYEPKSKKNQ